MSIILSAPSIIFVYNQDGSFKCCHSFSVKWSYYQYIGAIKPPLLKVDIMNYLQCKIERRVFLFTCIESIYLSALKVFIYN